MTDEFASLTPPSPSFVGWSPHKWGDKSCVHFVPPFTGGPSAARPARGAPTKSARLSAFQVAVQRLCEGGPGEGGALDADRILADPLESLEVAEDGTGAFRVETGIVGAIDRHHALEL